MRTKTAGSPRDSMMQWGSILTVIILTGICVLSLLLNYQSATAEMLPVSIQANEMADYSADEVSALNPIVNMEIIEAVIKDQDPTNVVERIENVRANLQTSVPTVTPTPVFTDTPVPVGGQPESSLATKTNTPPATATPRPPKTATASYTPPPGSTPTSTKTGTVDPTSTAGETSTATNDPQATATATSKPTQTTTKQPSATNTATNVPPGVTNTATKVPPAATNTATKAPPPTATNTATTVPTKPPPATKTATKTPTKIPSTATMTPTTGCTRPDVWMGFVEYTYPKDGAVNVPRDVTVVIAFDQPMYEGDLLKNIKVSGANVDYVMSYDSGTYKVKIDFLGLLEPGATILVEVKRNTKNICTWRQIVSVDFEFTIAKD